MLAALLTNLGGRASSASKYWQRVARRELFKIVEQTAEEAPAVAKVWAEVRNDEQIEPRLRAAATETGLDIGPLIQRAKVAQMLRIIAREIDDEETLVVLM